MTPAIRIDERCHYCSRWRSPLDVVYMPGGVKICLQCEQRHLEALASLSTGNFLGECSECGRTAEQIHSPTGAMAVHFEAGRYRAMCLRCDRTYVPKRRDIYGATEFGAANKL